MNLFVGNLSPETTEQNLRDIFTEFGNIVSLKIIIDPQTGLPKGFGFVEYDDKFSAYDAIDNIDATYFMGNIISVKEAKTSKPNNRPGGGGRPFQKRPTSGGYSNNRSGSNGFSGNRTSFSNPKSSRDGGYSGGRPSGFSNRRPLNNDDEVNGNKL